MTCEYCQTYRYTFQMDCAGCRQRLIDNEPCKILRKNYADNMEKKYGIAPDIRTDSNCGCVGKCKRRANIKDEQQTDRKRTPTFIRG